MKPFASSGCEAVDAMADVEFSGNVIPDSWYRAITRQNGKADLVAIAVLADIAYWYRPKVERDGKGNIVALRKRFASDMLQRSYTQLSERLCISKWQVRDAVDRLEERGTIRKHLRSATIGGLRMGNVLYIELDATALKAITAGDLVRAPSGKGSPYLSSLNDIGMGEDSHTSREAMTYLREPIGEGAHGIRDTSCNSHPKGAAEKLETCVGDTPHKYTDHRDYPETIHTREGLDDSDFEEAWSRVPDAKKSDGQRRKAERAWRATLEKTGATGGDLSRWYRAYVDDLEARGREEEYIATLSTWLKPGKPMAGRHTLRACLGRKRARLEAERSRAEREAAEALERAEADERERLERKWRESDPEALRLWSEAKRIPRAGRPSFSELSEAMGRYEKYRDERMPCA